MGFFAELVDEGTARQMAKIAGRSSAFAELDRRRAAGEDLVLVRPDESTIMIVPRSDISENVAQMPSRS